MKLFQFFVLLLICFACDPDCSNRDDSFVQNIDKYKQALQLLDKNKIDLSKEFKGDNGVLISIDKNDLNSLEGRQFSALVSLWKNKLLKDENSVEVYNNAVVYFYVKKCGRNHHYIVYDPKEILNIGVVDDITLYPLDDSWKYMIKRDM